MTPRAAALALALAVTAAAAPAGGPRTGDGWLVAHPAFRWSFPEDHSAHPGYRTEWWYFVGHLEGEGGRRLGYQFTLFRIGLLTREPELDSDWAASQLVMGHAALTDLDRGEHRFREVVRRAVPLLGGFPPHPDPLLAWVRAPAGTEGRWTLRLRPEGEGFQLAMRDDARSMALALTVRPSRPLVLQGPGGYSRKGRGPSAASQYYSMTRLETRGTVQLDGETLRVRGVSWMDREFGSNQLDEHQVGWDWFSLQLADGRDLMLYLLRDESGATDFSRATLLTPGAAPRYLESADWRLEVWSTWESPASGAVYPSGWRLQVPSEGLDVRIRPAIPDQENRGRIAYWEGSVVVLGPGGEPAGRGYAELTGYGPGNRPRL